MYNKSKLTSAKAQLRIVSQSYGDMVRTFLFQVGSFYLSTVTKSYVLLCGGSGFQSAHLIFSADNEQRRVSAVPQLQAGLQPALQEKGLQAEQAAHIFTQVTNCD